jgi:hypothetical protein
MEKSIKIIDNFLPAVLAHSIWIMARQGKYVKNNADVYCYNGSDNVPREKWRYTVEPDQRFETELVDNILNIIQGYNVDNVYYNYSTFTDVDHIHTDIAPGLNGLTALYYCNLHWNREYGGETFFYSDDLTEISKVVEYIPNRLVIFDGTIPHTAKQPTIAAPYGRYTLAVKLTKVNNES